MANGGGRLAAGMDFIREDENDTPSPGLDGHKGQSETCTEDDGSEGTIDRDTLCADRRSGRPQQRISPLNMSHSSSSSSTSTRFNSAITPGSRADSSKEPRLVSGVMQMDNSSSGDDGSPFSFLEDGDTFHKRKISELSREGGKGNHHHANSDASIKPNDPSRMYTKTIMGLGRENFFLKQQCGVSSNQVMQVNQELSVAQTQLHCLRLLVAKLASAQPVQPHEQQLLSECLRYAQVLRLLALLVQKHIY
jgi:hypothetical protein